MSLQEVYDMADFCGVEHYILAHVNQLSKRVYTHVQEESISE